MTPLLLQSHNKTSKLQDRRSQTLSACDISRYLVPATLHESDQFYDFNTTKQRDKEEIETPLDDKALRLDTALHGGHSSAYLIQLCASDNKALRL